MTTELTEIANTEHSLTIGDREAAVTVEEIEAELHLDNIVHLMSDVPWGEKLTAPGRSPSGLPSDGFDGSDA
jgi:hypothetical protein